MFHSHAGSQPWAVLAPWVFIQPACGNLALMGWLGHRQKEGPRVEGGIGFLHYVFPATWKEASVPSQADLQMCGHRGNCAAPQRSE